MTIKEFFSFKQNKFFWINLIAMVIVVALVLFGVLKGLDIYTRHGEAVVVPNVKVWEWQKLRKCSATKDLPALFPTPAM